jgi:hypothetical protein
MWHAALSMPSIFATCSGRLNKPLRVPETSLILASSFQPVSALATDKRR